MSDLLIPVEIHAQLSTPAAKEILLDGWRLRATGGRTKRFNSVNFQGELAGSLPLEDKLQQVEDFYEEAGQVPLYRITPLMTPDNLAARLEARGYASADATDVVFKDLVNLPSQGIDPNVVLLDTPSNDWLLSMAKLTEKSPEQLQSFKEMRARLTIPTLFAAYLVEGEITSVGMATFWGDIMGMFEFATSPDFRRRGQAEAIVNALQQAARGRQCHTAYLQVVVSNGAAQGFWKSLGFTEKLCTYYYMSRPQD